MLIEFRNAIINASAVSALVLYDEDGKKTVRIILGAHELTFSEVTVNEYSFLVSSLVDSYERWRRFEQSDSDVHSP